MERKGKPSDGIGQRNRRDLSTVFATKCNAPFFSPSRLILRARYTFVRSAKKFPPFSNSRHPLPFVALTSRIFARLCRSKKSSSGFLKMTFNHSQGARIMTDNDKFFSVSGLTEKKSLDSLRRRDTIDSIA